MGAVGTVGVAALGATGPAAVAGLTAAAVGAAVAVKYCMMILESYRWSPFVPITLDTSMLTVLLLLPKYRLRNVPVTEPDKPIIKNFITQTGVVITVNNGDLILEAFKCMKDNKIGGVPVVEGPNRNFVGQCEHKGCIKPSDYLLTRESFFKFCISMFLMINLPYRYRQLTVMEFMKTIGSTVPDSGKPPLTSSPDASLGSVIDSIASRITHRIYVVDGDFEVVGVVTLRARDVISCFIYEPPGYCDDYLASAMDKLEDKGAGSTVPDSGKPPLTSSPDASLGSVIDSIASRITHRIYVVDGDFEVVGVVTLRARDVISCFIYEPPGYCDDYLASAMDKLEDKGAGSVDTS
uniref:CBS domain-containing protein n=1 Tax=Oryza meridionalis TaxID=40149 RepID=A0A0E0DQJ6_9ORYZ